MLRPALELVLTALEQIRETSDHAPCASREALSRLFAASVVVPQADPANLLEPIRDRVSGCTKCPHLARSRTQTVFGVGNPNADLMFVGEAPGADEDAQGEPFVGRAGQLLTKIIKAMGLRREDVYIANIIKCRPPGNRTPERDECETCSPFLMQQIKVISPKA